MENLEIGRLLRKAQVLEDDIHWMESVDTARAFRSVQQKVRAARRRQRREQLMRYAAMLTLPLLITSLVFGYLYFRQPEPMVQYAEVTAAAGSVIRYELPDQTVVWLNAGTTLRYPTIFQADRRDVELNGEAYFEVKADQNHPFYVRTADGPTVYVYGTKFNVSAYADDAFVSTVLEQGKVNVLLSPQETAVLHPNDQLVYDKTDGRWSKNKVDVYEKVAWKDGKLVFRNASLEEIFKKLSRHFNVEILFHNHVEKDLHYRATFRQETLPQIMDYLSRSGNLKWSVQDAVQHADGTLSKKKYIVNTY
ncbi:Fe(2+)-dicitrate sensor, transmembrane component [gut metagenome]|uniref:Fe(2+)-dicitrate sensor, transmembrane component n=1 Tax=gut metagenome TaxID=749906 RepID=J9GMR3_9ZZZZ